MYYFLNIYPSYPILLLVFYYKKNYIDLQTVWAKHFCGYKKMQEDLFYKYLQIHNNVQKHRLHMYTYQYHTDNYTRRTATAYFHCGH